MSENAIGLLYGTEEEFAAVFKDWRKPATKPVRVEKTGTNPFTGATQTYIVYDVEYPFDEPAEDEEWEESTYDMAGYRALELMKFWDIPQSILDKFNWWGPPILCDRWQNEFLKEVPPEGVEELLDGRLEQRLRDTDPETLEIFSEMLQEIRQEVAAARKEGGLLGALWNI